MAFGATDIKKCSCKNEYQDEKYGKGMRVHNIGKIKGGIGESYVCTVCGSRK